MPQSGKEALKKSRANLVPPNRRFPGAGLIAFLARIERMTTKTYSVRFKPNGIESQIVVAATAEIYDEYLVLLDSTGKLAALFLMEIVESWSEFPG